MVDEMALLVADVYETAGVLRRWGEDLARTAGQTQARWQVLSVSSTEPLTVPRAARRLGISRQAVQRVVNDLERDGLLELQVNPDHRSSPLMALTTRGKETLAKIGVQAEQAHRALAGTIPPHELIATRELLQRLITEGPPARRCERALTDRACAHLSAATPRHQHRRHERRTVRRRDHRRGRQDPTRPRSDEGVTGTTKRVSSMGRIGFSRPPRQASGPVGAGSVQ